MYSIKAKLKSRTGASITFALLLFLVCAVVGSVVLTAGTAAAGRAGDLTKMDQRYYAVTSAAELLRDLMEGESVTVVETAPLNDSGAADWDSATIRLNGRDVSGGTDLQSIPETAAYDFLIQKSSVSISRSYTLSAAEHNELGVDIEEELSSDGTLLFRITSDFGVSGGSGGEYALKEVFKPDLQETEGKNEQTGTALRTRKVTWRLADLATERTGSGGGSGP